MSIMRIAQVLLRESDRDHPLTQQEILDFMETKYAMTVSRKSIGRNLSRLKEAGLPVVCREVTRVVNGKEAPLALDWYWDHVLSQDDLKVLIDLLYFSHLPAQQVRQLSEKLKRLQSRTFDDGKENIKNLPALGRPGESGEVLALLTRALSQKKQVSFYYDHYEADGKKHHGYTVSGEDKLYRVSPYHLVASDDRYFLLGNEEDVGMIADRPLHCGNALFAAHLKVDQIIREYDQPAQGDGRQMQFPALCLDRYFFRHDANTSRLPLDGSVRQPWQSGVFS